MKHKKRLFRFLLTLCMLCTFIPATAFAENQTEQQQVQAGMPFTDVKQGAWYYDAVSYVYEHNLMVGTSDTLFTPQGSMNRAMVAQILYSMEGRPAVSGSPAFRDVSSGAWYYNAIQWASQNDIAAGTGNGLFNPTGKVTREQFAQFLYSYAGKPAVEGTLDFPDAGNVSSWAVNAMTWATQNKLINGNKKPDGQLMLEPTGKTTRAQAAVILRFFCENVVASGTCGDNLTWTLDRTGTLRISGTGEMYNWDSDNIKNVPWYDVRKQIKNATIGNDVTTIGDSAFYYCFSLTSVTIPDSVTTIGNNAFYYCSSLTSVTIPDSVTTIGSSAFWSCSSLTSVTIPDSVTTIGDSAFYYCKSLTSVTIGTGVTSIANQAFSSCSSLTSVTIGSSVTTIGSSAFSSCSSLTSVTIPDSVTTIGNDAFKSCSSLTSVTIPDSVTTIGSSAFWSCSSLTSVTIPDSVTTIGSSAFSRCKSLTAINVNKNNTAYCSVNGVLLNKNQTQLLQYPGGKSGAYTIPDSVTAVGFNAFYYCDGLTSVTIPDSVMTIGSSAFFSCSSLTSVTIGTGVTHIANWAFDSCNSLTDVYYRGSKTQWEAIIISSNNDPLTSATIHYNS